MIGPQALAGTAARRREHIKSRRIIDPQSSARYAPLRLTSSDDSNFNLTIAGYQYPHLAAEPHDLNWSHIQLELDIAQGRRQATAPYPLTYEVAELADWLEQVASGS
jgi:hypothetical protein